MVGKNSESSNSSRYKIHSNLIKAISIFSSLSNSPSSFRTQKTFRSSTWSSRTRRSWSSGSQASTRAGRPPSATRSPSAAWPSASIHSTTSGSNRLGYFWASPFCLMAVDSSLVSQPAVVPCWIHKILFKLEFNQQWASTVLGCEAAWELLVLLVPGWDIDAPQSRVNNIESKLSCWWKFLVLVSVSDWANTN